MAGEKFVNNTKLVENRSLQTSRNKIGSVEEGNGIAQKHDGGVVKIC